MDRYDPSVEPPLFPDLVIHGNAQMKPDTADAFFGQPIGHYGAIYADPPWSFKNFSKKGEGRNPNQHYRCMSLDEIKALPVSHLAKPDCALFLWVTDPLLKEGIEVMEAWGFTYKTVAFTWAKRTKRFDGEGSASQPWHMGTGYWTRSNPEMCLFGTMGAPKRLSCGVRQLVEEPVREHSRKPERIRDDICRLVHGPYIELFSRSSAPGWDSWGNEVGKFDG